MTITLEDKADIAELIARFAHYSDFGDWDALAKLYVPEVETEMEGIPLRFRGIDEQIEHAKVSDQQTQGKNRHYNFNLFISEEDGSVQALHVHERQRGRDADVGPDRRVRADA